MTILEAHRVWGAADEFSYAAHTALTLRARIPHESPPWASALRAVTESTHQAIRDILAERLVPALTIDFLVTASVADVVDAKRRADALVTTALNEIQRLAAIQRGEPALRVAC
ncbi:MAG: hypothetical protein ACHREM_00900 [Polyangiales bacterium]